MSGPATTTSTSGLQGGYNDALNGFLGQVGGAMSLPYQNYQGPRVANLSPLQTQAANGYGALLGGTPGTEAANKMLTGTLNGAGFTDPTRNSYSGNSPQFQANLQAGLGDITHAYDTGTSAELTRLMNMSGALGGSAHTNAMENNQRELGRTLSNYEGQQRDTQYNRSAGLEDNYLQRGQQEYDAERNRQMGAAGQTSQNINNYANLLGQTMQAGDVSRAHDQSVIDANYGDFNRANDYPWTQINRATSALGPLFGAAGRTTSTTGPGSDPVGQAVGGLALANSLGGKGGGGSGTSSSKGGGGSSASSFVPDSVT